MKNLKTGRRGAIVALGLAAALGFSVITPAAQAAGKHFE